MRRDCSNGLWLTMYWFKSGTLFDDILMFLDDDVFDDDDVLMIDLLHAAFIHGHTCIYFRVR